MRLQVLGPVELSAADGPIYLARRQQRLVLGILAVEANRHVSCDQLIDLVWGGHPPRQARAVVQSRVSEIRAALAGHLEGQQGLVTRGNGYVLDIEPELVDVHKFRLLVEQAHDADDEQTRKLLRSALELWRGPVLGGWLPAYSHATLCGGIEALRVTVAEELFAVELKLGRHHSVVDEVNELAAANLGREGLTALAMTALYRTGRTAEALQLFDRCRRWLADELGVDPGTELQELHVDILRGGSEPLVRDADNHRQTVAVGGRPDTTQDREQPSPETFSVAQPQLLPVDIPDFTGRTVELARLHDALTGIGGGARLAVVSGPAGVGKTALSVHVAHLLRERFPHGQLYVNLHGADRTGPSPSEVLARFLRALGVDSAMPDTLDERAELYRDLVAGRDILVVLDNARDADQVRPLIPGSSSCAVLITSRTRLAAAVGGNSVDLEVLTDPHAVDLMARITGAERVRSEPLAAAGLATLCGGLPLAIRIAAARLVAKPHWSIGRLVDRLADEQRRLDQLSYEDLNVRASIALSCAGLSPDAQLLLCRLGDLDLPEINVWTSAALLDIHPMEAEEVLEQLYDAQLIDVAGREAGGYSRYRLHDLVRLFAKERARSDDDPSALRAARHRAFGAWLYVTEMAYGKVYGDGSENIASPAPRHDVGENLASILTADPLIWFDTERQSIIRIIHETAKDQQSAFCWGLACTSFSLFEMRRYFDDCRNILDTASALVTTTSDSLGHATVLYRMAPLSSARNDNEQALRQFRQAAALFEESGDRHGWALATSYIAMIHRLLNRNDLAITYLHHALADLRNGSDKGAEAFALRNLAQSHLETADYHAADGYLEQALELARLGKSRRREAQILFYQGMLRLEQDRCLEAERLFVEVLTLTRALGDRPGQIQAQRGLALSCERTGDRDRAEAMLLTALQLAHQPGPTLFERRIREELARLRQSDQ